MNNLLYLLVSAIEQDVYIYIWLFALIGLIVFEALTAQIVALWFIVASAVSLILAICGVPFWIQGVTFGVVSMALLIFSQPLIKKLAAKKELKTNAEELTEEVGVVVKEIPTDDIGEVKVKYQVWNEISENNTPISVGTKVEIVEILGNKLIVRIKK